MIDITIIGLGNVGSSLAFLLLNSKHSIRLNIVDPSPDCEGAYLDLAHSVALCQEKEIYLNDDKLLQNASFIYYAAGVSNFHGASRLSTAKKNIELTKSIFKGIRFNKDPYIFVITNPVDVISESVFRSTNLAPEKIIGTGTFLDSIRLAHYLSSISQINVSAFETIVVGEHGDSQVPLYSMCKVNGQSILTHPRFTYKVLETVTNNTKRAAFQIRETQEATIYGVSQCAAALLDYFLSKNEHALPLSLLTNDHYRKLLNLEEDIFVGIPAIIKNGKIKINNNIELLEEELTDYRASAKIISEAVQKFNSGKNQ